MSNLEFAQCLSNDLRAASEEVEQKKNDPLNNEMQREMEASAMASAVAAMKEHASRFSDICLRDIFRMLQDVVLGEGYHVAAHNVSEYNEASGIMGKRLTAGRNTEIVATIGYAPEFLTAGVTSTSESGGIIFRHEQVFTAGQFKDEAVASWFSSQLRQAVVLMVQVGALVKTTAGTTK